MPIYEYRCGSCNRVSSFFTRSIGAALDPVCAHCQSREMQRRMSSFSMGKTTQSVHERTGADPNSPDYYSDPRNIGRHVEGELPPLRHGHAPVGPGHHRRRPGRRFAQRVRRRCVEDWRPWDAQQVKPVKCNGPVLKLAPMPSSIPWIPCWPIREPWVDAPDAPGLLQLVEEHRPAHWRSPTGTLRRHTRSRFAWRSHP